MNGELRSLPSLRHEASHGWSDHQNSAPTQVGLHRDLAILAYCEPTSGRTNCNHVLKGPRDGNP